LGAPGVSIGRAVAALSYGIHEPGASGHEHVWVDKLAMIRSTFPVLDEWHASLSQPLVPDPGSELARDDLDWPPVRLSQVAAMGLGSARDHLHAVRVLIEARQLSPFAQLTLIRAGLVGAAQAVWVLSPDARAERLSRARCVAAHMYREHAKYLTVLQALAGEPHEGTDTVAAAVAQRSNELAAKRQANEERAALNTTEMVREAALAAFSDEALANEVVSIWRLTSGAAHGFAWALLGQPGTTHASDPDSEGIVSFAAGGDLDRVANQYLGAFHLARHGMELMRQRSASASASSS
jgi:hypothetical protein